jgi:site-specific DNA recombinase
MRRGRHAKMQSGRLLPWTRPPYGYRADPERPRDPALVQLDTPKAAIVAEIFATYADGGATLFLLAKRLTERGIPSPTGRRH